MPVTRFTTANGVIISEKRGGNRFFYAADPVGSTVAMFNASGTLTDSFAYWPYGELRSSSGSTASSFKYCGTWGYFTETTGRTYIRGRFYRDKIARWQTVDGFWPELSAYRYGDSNPVSSIDPSGYMTWYQKHLKCLEAIAKMRQAVRLFHDELAKYNPWTDALGGHRMRGGRLTRPFGHWNEMNSYRQSYINGFIEYMKFCNNNDNWPRPRRLLEPVPRRFGDCEPEKAFPKFDRKNFDHLPNVNPVILPPPMPAPVGGGFGGALLRGLGRAAGAPIILLSGFMCLMLRPPPPGCPERDRMDREGVA